MHNTVYKSGDFLVNRNTFIQSPIEKIDSRKNQN